MKLLCNTLMLLTAMPMAFVGIMSLVHFPKAEYDLRLVVGAILFSGALVGRCVLETAGRRDTGVPPTAATDGTSRRG